MLLFTEYILLAIGVIIISIYLSKYVDALDKKTKLSGAFIGGIMLAAVTSLPELFTSITAVVFLNQYQLVLKPAGPQEQYFQHGGGKQFPVQHRRISDAQGLGN